MLKIAIVKFNSGMGAVLCNNCRTIVKTGFRVEDKEHLCTKCIYERNKKE
jgi:hypothetical protein